MAEINLSQKEADSLIAMEKVLSSGKAIVLPSSGRKITLNCFSADKKEEFILDCARGSIKLSKISHQIRARKVVPLVRLDIDSSPHLNPDGEWISGSHIHIYRAGYADKYAYEIPEDFKNLSDMTLTFRDFMAYCNIKNIPDITAELF